MQDTPLSTKLRTLFTKEFPISQTEKKMKTIQGNLGPLWDQIGSKLNSIQQKAICRYLDRNEKDFLLIHGMPGTGKKLFIYLFVCLKKKKSIFYLTASFKQA